MPAKMYVLAAIVVAGAGRVFAIPAKFVNR